MAAFVLLSLTRTAGRHRGEVNLMTARQALAPLEAGPTTRKSKTDVTRLEARVRWLGARG